MNFEEAEVETFGFTGSSSTGEVLYYITKEDFAIVLLPRDAEHEILLVKTPFPDKINFEKEVINLEKKISDFRKNKSESNFWKYIFNEEDSVKIPIIEFNIETSYPTIEGTEFKTGKALWRIDTAKQRTAFVLNEKGAELESKAEMFAGESAPIEKPEPKTLMFDKPFLVYLKRKDSQYPYFAMFVANSELLKKQVNK